MMSHCGVCSLSLSKSNVLNVEVKLLTAWLCVAFSKALTDVSKNGPYLSAVLMTVVLLGRYWSSVCITVLLGHYWSSAPQAAGSLAYRSRALMSSSKSGNNSSKLRCEDNCLTLGLTPSPCTMVIPCPGSYTESSIGTRGASSSPPRPVCSIDVPLPGLRATGVMV